MSTAIYNQEAHREWVRRLGMLHADLGPSGEFDLESRQVGVWWPVGCYIAVDHHDRVKYVGKVCRADAGYDARFASHRQDVLAWEKVWLLPLRLDLGEHLVEAVEALLIWVLRPTDNIVRPAIKVVQVQEWMRHGL